MHNCKCKLNLFFLILFAIFSVGISAQTEALKMPEISSYPEMPATPVITVPAVSSSWYVPGRTNIKNITPENNETSEKQNNFTAVGKESNNVLQKKDDSQFLSSADLITLKNLGLLSSIDGILSSDNVNLSSLISKLKILRNDNNLPQLTNYDSICAPVNSGAASILYFSVDGTEISALCRNILFSGVETNGTFLVSGDYRYSKENKSCCDTFYFLFKATGTKDGQTVYSVTPALTQNSTNENSALYKLSKEKSLQAMKTGSIVSIHNVTENISVDMLMSLSNSISLDK